jgi:hypothetical protein
MFPIIIYRILRIVPLFLEPIQAELRPSPAFISIGLFGGVDLNIHLGSFGESKWLIQFQNPISIPSLYSDHGSLLRKHSSKRILAHSGCKGNTECSFAGVIFRQDQTCGHVQVSAFTAR